MNEFNLRGDNHKFNSGFTNSPVFYSLVVTSMHYMINQTNCASNSKTKKD